MTKKSLFANIGRFFGVYFLSAIILAAVFFLVGLFDDLIDEYAAMNAVYYAMIALCLISPIIFGRLILKNTGTALDNLFSLLMPCAILAAVLGVLLYIFTYAAYDYSIGMIICIMNFPMYVLTQFTPEELFVPIVSAMPFVTAVLSFIGLMTKSRKNRGDRTGEPTDEQQCF